MDLINAVVAEACRILTTVPLDEWGMGHYMIVYLGFFGPLIAIFLAFFILLEGGEWLLYWNSRRKRRKNRRAWRTSMFPD